MLVAVTAVALLTSPTAGWARGAVTATTPPDGAVLDVAPAAVELTLSARPDPGLSHVAVRDDSGSAVRAGALTSAGANGLRLAVSVTKPGNFTVAYHVELVGGGELTGFWRFSFGTGVAPPPADRVDPVAADGHGHGVDPIGATLLAIDGAVVLCVVVLLLRRPRRPASSEPPE